MQIAKTISALKEAEGLTIRGLARAAKLHENTVRKALGGENITVHTAEQLLDVLGHKLVVVKRGANKKSASVKEAANG